VNHRGHPGERRAIWRWAQLVGLRSGHRCAEATLLASVIDYKKALGLSGNDTDLTASWESPDPTEQVSAAVEVQKILANAMGDHEAQQYLSHLRSRYSVAANVNLAEQLQNPELMDEVRAENRYLLDRLRTVYLLRIRQDNFLRLIEAHSIIMLFVFLLVVGGAAWIQSVYPPGGSFSNYATIAAVGAIGSLISILRRTQGVTARDPVHEDPVMHASMIGKAYWGIWISQMMGPVFALVLLMLFMSGAISFAGLTPNFVPCVDGACQFRFLDHFMRFKEPMDASKAIIWARCSR
jgi:hypothetical protein